MAAAKSRWRRLSPRLPRLAAARARYSGNDGPDDELSAEDAAMMIIKGGSRSNGGFFAKHLTNDWDEKNGNGRVELKEMRGGDGDDG